jgi:hypothetical protein
MTFPVAHVAGCDFYQDAHTYSTKLHPRVLYWVSYPKFNLSIPMPIH